MSEQGKIKFDEFKSAFKDARYRALSHFLANPDYDEYNSLAMLQLLPKPQQDILLKNVYERSYHLGLEISQRYKKIEFKEEIVHLLSYTGIPCVSGNWQNNSIEMPLILSQTKCPEVGELTDYSPNIIKCRYWHESIKGVLAGINQEIKFSGTKVLGSGKDICVNFIFDGAISGDIWQSLPDNIHEFLLKLKKLYNFFSINFVLEYYSDGNVYYRLEKEKNFSSWLNYSILINLFLKTYLLKMPSVNLFEL